MRVVVMSDIHGFDLALETVLADLDARGPFDEVVVAGDLCEEGPAPDEVLARVQERSFTVLMGNTDRDLVEVARQGGGRGREHFPIARIGPAGVDYLAELSFSRRITPPGGTSPDDDLLAVHANPHNLDDKLDDAMSDRELGEVLGDTRAAVIAFGHHHVTFTRQIGDILLVDVSAVGNPKDRDLRCKYGIFTWDEEARAWSVEIRKLDYPLAATEAQILASDLLAPEKTLRKLKKASY